MVILHFLEVRREGGRFSFLNMLVVKDEKKQPKFIDKDLEEHGFAVIVLHNSALACVGPFDLIVLDIMLPNRDGLSILKNL